MDTLWTHFQKQGGQCNKVAPDPFLKGAQVIPKSYVMPTLNKIIEAVLTYSELSILHIFNLLQGMTCHTSFKSSFQMFCLIIRLTHKTC